MSNIPLKKLEVNWIAKYLASFKVVSQIDLAHKIPSALNYFF